ncbi:hypothetical protein [Faecalispora jeddahensis]|uniref:hypothetical protein n=1 Tax=Faecalispora jeddahensis TaxID=1414721 RepID=UPI00145A4D78|nr:hypothetical protein [Faecalispora jeddahensis]
MNLVDPDIVSNFVEWKDANKDNFTWWSYVNIKSDIQGALAFANFFCPEIIIKDNCILLKDHFNQKNYDDWKERLNGDKTQIEKIMNIYEIQDFFHIHSDTNDPFYNEQIKALAKSIQFYWSLTLQHNHPDKNIIVSVFEEYDALCITVYGGLE